MDVATLRRQWARARRLLGRLHRRIVDGPPLRPPEEPPDDPRRTIGYMCRVAWQHELGHDGDGTIVYPTPDALRRGQQCVRAGQCGIIEVRVVFRRQVTEGVGDE
jgi:hypothetical protein